MKDHQEVKRKHHIIFNILCFPSNKSEQNAINFPLHFGKICIDIFYIMFYFFVV